jgi:hypothetical protein
VASEDPVEVLLSDLRLTAGKMQTLSAAALYLLAVCLMGLFVTLIMRSASSQPFSTSWEDLVRYLTLGSAMYGLTALFLYDRRRRHGDVLFEELSNELQWQAVSGSSIPKAAESRPSIENRVTLRNYVQASDLPLVPGKFGPTAYAITFLIIAVICVLVRI